MISWPQKTTPIPFKHVPEHCSCCSEARNDAIDACIEAEKSGRMSVEEIEKIVGDVYYEALGKNLKQGHLHEMVAIAIITALYGDTKPDGLKK